VVGANQTPHTVNIVGSQNVNLGVYVNLFDFGNNTFDTSWSINQSTPGSSSFTGSIQLDNAPFSVSAVAGGRLNLSGDLFTSTSTAGLVKTGAGTVILSHANDYSIQGSVAADILQGKLLITNTSGSAFGVNSGVVNVEAGATLGGTGISTQKVVAVNGSSIIAPGDSGADGGTASIGTLHLFGGLQVASGATLAFKIDGANNDVLDLGHANFIPVGLLTFDFTNLSTVLIPTFGNPNFYTLITGSGNTWNDAGATFAFNAPAGYKVNAYNFDPILDQFSVQFVEAPEPSTYALMLGGLALLGFCVRRKASLFRC
jgi:hypothetical protein